MKKLILILMLLISAAEALQAQTFAEWFQQNKTQKRYLLQQIAALQAYIGYAQKGYKIAKEGLTTIGGFTKEEFDLHSDFFISLRTVNPHIKHYAKVAEIAGFHFKIVQGYRPIFRQLSNSDAFSANELAYFQSIFSRLLDDCEQTLDELIMVTTDANLEMKDDERMKRIDLLYRDLQDKYTFFQSFSNDTRMVATSRIKEQTEVQTSRAWQGIKIK